VQHAGNLAWRAQLTKPQFAQVGFAGAVARRRQLAVNVTHGGPPLSGLNLTAASCKGMGEMLKPLVRHFRLQRFVSVLLNNTIDL